MIQIHKLSKSTALRRLDDIIYANGKHLFYFGVTAARHTYPIAATP